MRSEGDPKIIPRDKECSACQEEENMPFELSERELLWQRHMKELGEFIKKNPFEALFGTSNLRLGSFSPKPSPNSISVKYGGREIGIFKMVDGYRSMFTPSSSGYPHSATAGEQKHEGERTEESLSNTANKTTVSQEQKASTIHGHAVWSASGLSGSDSFSASGELEFDPITMRMVPKSAKVSKEQEHPKVNQTQSRPEIPVPEPANKSVNNPVEECAGSGTGVLSMRHADILKRPHKKHESDSNTEVRGDQASKPRRRSEDELSEKETSEWGQTMSHGLPTQRPYQDLLRGKQMLERSWMNEVQSRRKAELEVRVKATEKGIKARHLNSESERSSANNVAREPILNTMPPQYRNVEAKKAYTSTFRKDKPLKHMSHMELHKHATNLLANLDSKLTKKIKTPADQKLDEEIKEQEMAMTAFENKSFPRKFIPPRTSLSVGRLPPLNPATTASSSLSSLAPGGDLGADFASPASTDEHREIKASPATAPEDEYACDIALTKNIRQIYEKGSMTIDTPRGSAIEDQYMRDRKLVQDIRQIYEKVYGTIRVSEIDYLRGRKLAKDVRQIYEKSYGTINVNHTQGKLKESHQEYDPKVDVFTRPSAQGGDDGTVKPTAILSTTHQSDAKLEESLQDYERKVGPSPYTFMPGDETRTAEPTAQDSPAAASSETSATTTTTAPKSSNTASALRSQKVLERRNLKRAQRALKRERREQRRMKQKETTAKCLDKDSELKAVPEAFTDAHLYRLLAYEPSDQSILTASASSFFKVPKMKSTNRSPVARLQNPAKFFPHLAKHQADGYEIVSAMKHLLILKRVRSIRSVTDSPTTTPESIPVIVAPTTLAEQQPKRRSVRHRERETSSEDRVNPIDGTTTPCAPPVPPTQTGNFASPTGFVNHDVFTHPPPLPRPRPSSDSPRVRREEPVFSGTSKNRDAWQWKVPAAVGRHSSEPGASTPASRSTGNPITWQDHRAASLRKKPQQRDQREREIPRSGSTGSVRKALLIGGWTAACCYTTGLLVEYLRTGPGGGAGAGSSGGSGARNFVRRSWDDVASAVAGGGGGGAAAGNGRSAEEARLAREGEERGEGIARAMLAGVSTAVVTVTVLAWLGSLIGTDP